MCFHLPVVLTFRIDFMNANNFGRTKKKKSENGALPFSTLVHITNVQNNYDIKYRALR